MKCCVCQKTYSEGDEIYTLSDTEKRAIGKDAPDKLCYCQPCLKIIRDPIQGPQLLKGSQEMYLHEIGVNPFTASRVSQNFYEKLLKLKRRH